MKAFYYTLGFMLAGVGALIRYKLSDWFSCCSFPFGTLLVNVVGSFLIGFVASASHLPMGIRLVLMAGFLGALTTFSSYSLDTLRMLQRSDWTMAVLNVSLNNVLAIMSCWVGTLLYQQAPE